MRVSHHPWLAGVSVLNSREDLNLLLSKEQHLQQQSFSFSSFSKLLSLSRVPVTFSSIWIRFINLVILQCKYGTCMS